MLMLDLAKQGKQELHVLFFPSLHAPSHLSDPMKERGSLFIPGEKESLSGQRENWEHAWVQDTCLARLLNILHHVPSSDAPANNFPLFPLSNRDKVYIVLHVVFEWRSQKFLTERNFHYSITKPRITRTCHGKTQSQFHYWERTLISFTYFCSISVLAIALSVT